MDKQTEAVQSDPYGLLTYCPKIPHSYIIPKDFAIQVCTCWDLYLTKGFTISSQDVATRELILDEMELENWNKHMTKSEYHKLPLRF